MWAKGPNISSTWHHAVAPNAAKKQPDCGIDFALLHQGSNAFCMTRYGKHFDLALHCTPRYSNAAPSDVNSVQLAPFLVAQTTRFVKTLRYSNAAPSGVKSVARPFFGRATRKFEIKQEPLPCQI